jgi:hypothetical protein
MSIQFRSRITPAIDYSTILTNYGFCCGLSGSNGLPISKTYIECVTEGGFYVKGASGQEVSCPQYDDRYGCCCSCSYVDPDDYNQIEAYPPSIPYLTSGTRSRMTKCECERIGGKFTPTADGNCPALTNENWESYCAGQHPDNPTLLIDVRAPRSCCHLEYDPNTGWPTTVVCKDVCTSADCAELSTETYPSTFTLNARCNIPLRANGNLTNCSNAQNLAFVANQPIYQGFDMGSCYSLVNVNGTYEYECSITPQEKCDGYWIIQQDQNNAFCKNTLQPTNPQKSGSVYLPESMTLSAFNALGLTNGDAYLGGTFIGIYKTGSSSGKSSEIYGNINFGDASFGRFIPDSIGGTHSQWAIIVDEIPVSLPFLGESEKDIDVSTSLWDGYYNTYGNGSTFQGVKTALTNQIRYQPRKGFLDYYIPSIYELNFYAAYLYNNDIKDKGNLISSSFFNTKYISSGPSKSKINNSSFVYGQAIKFYYTSNYKNILIDKRNTETVLFFRRILLT